MTSTNGKFRPYAAPANVIATIERCRSRNLPPQINNDFLRVVGIPEVVLSRVLQTFKFLGLVYDDLGPSDKLQALVSTTDAQYQEMLDKIVREAYRVEFNMIDPSHDSWAQIVDAFKPCEPRSQINRMATLFLGLCREAGIEVKDAPRERRMQTGKGREATRAPSHKERVRQTQAGQHYRSSPLSTKESLFALTEDDINVLSSEEFDEVWTALGKVARARAKAKIEKESQKESQVEPTEDTGSLPID
jgi:hypothetical protein